MTDRAPKKIIAFLDRDGVLNEEIDLLHTKERLRLLPGSAQAVRRLNRSGIIVVVVTNQPAVARGLCTEQDVQELHALLGEMLARQGAHLDAVYYCPHHENADVPFYRKLCPDRKPNAGMLRSAAERFGVALSSCFMIGDRTVDVLAGVNAGCTTILVKTGYGGTDHKHAVKPDRVAADLREAVDIVLQAAFRKDAWAASR